MSSYRWNGGGNLKSRKWDTDLPTDCAVRHTHNHTHTTTPTHSLTQFYQHIKTEWMSMSLGLGAPAVKLMAWVFISPPPLRFSPMCCARIWTPGYPLTLNTQTGKPSPRSTSATLRTNPVSVPATSLPSRPLPWGHSPLDPRSSRQSSLEQSSLSRF